MAAPLEAISALPHPEEPVQDEAPPGRSPAAEAWRRFRANKLAVAGLVVILVLTVTAVAGPFFVGDPNAIDKHAFNKPPSSEHPFGTTKAGEDVLARTVYGARISLGIGLAAVLIEVIIGVGVGALAGWFGGWFDTAAMRFIDILLGIPYLLLTFAVVGAIGRGIPAVIISIGVTAWLATARVMRAQFLALKHRDFVDAARAIGARPRRIIWRHMLPNASQPIIVYSAIGVGTAILAEAALSFLGVGVKPGTPSWGQMIHESKGIWDTSPHLLLFPGLAITITVLAFVLVGDGLRDALDVRD